MAGSNRGNLSRGRLKSLAQAFAEEVSKENPDVYSIVDEFEKYLELVRLQMVDYRRWYSFLLIMYESTDLFEDKLGFTVEKVVPAGSSFEYYWDLIPYNVACLCPVYISGTTNPAYCKLYVELEAYPPPTFTVRTTITVAPEEPMPHVDNMPSLPEGFYYTQMPKAKGVTAFYNDDPANDAYCIFHADFLPMEVETARKLIWLVKEPLIKVIEEVLVSGATEV